jgi:hypothetical protein
MTTARLKREHALKRSGHICAVQDFLQAAAIRATDRYGQGSEEAAEAYAAVDAFRHVAFELCHLTGTPLP